MIVDYLIGLVFLLRIAAIIYEKESQRITDSLDGTPLTDVCKVSAEAVKLEAISAWLNLSFYVSLTIILALVIAR